MFCYIKLLYDNVYEYFWWSDHEIPWLTQVQSLLDYTKINAWAKITYEIVNEEWQDVEYIDYIITDEVTANLLKWVENRMNSLLDKNYPIQTQLYILMGDDENEKLTMKNYVRWIIDEFNTNWVDSDFSSYEI